MIRIFTDGGSRGNPGPAGAGGALYDGDAEVGSVSKFLGVQTNNVAEYEALRLSLEKACEIFGQPVSQEVHIYMDSELIVKQMKGEYRVKDAKLQVIHKKVKDILTASFSHVSFHHVRREENTRADALANEAMDRGR